MSTKLFSPERHTKQKLIMPVPETPPETEGFFIDLKDEMISPIRKAVSGIGRISLDATLPQLQDRHDNWFRIELDGYAQAVHVTEPKNNNSHSASVIHLPGFSEIIEAGPGLLLHQTLANEMPERRIISVGTDGIGALGDKYTFAERKDHGIEAMAEQRQKLIRALCADDRVILQGLSMGSVIANRVLDYDRRQGHELNAYPLYFDTALVTPRLAKYVMGLVFPSSMLFDTPRELDQMVKKYGIEATLENLKMPMRHFKGNALPMIVQGLDLIKGTPYEQIKRVANRYGTTTVSGSLDPLAQQGMWSHIKKSEASTHIQGVRLRGHGIAADGVAGGKKIANVSEKYSDEIFAA